MMAALIQARLEAEAQIFRHKSELAARRGDSIGRALSEHWAAESTLASLRAASIASRLSTSIAHPVGANDAC